MHSNDQRRQRPKPSGNPIVAFFQNKRNGRHREVEDLQAKTKRFWRNPRNRRLVDTAVGGAVGAAIGFPVAGPIGSAVGGGVGSLIGDWITPGRKTHKDLLETAALGFLGGAVGGAAGTTLWSAVGGAAGGLGGTYYTQRHRRPMPPPQPQPLREREESEEPYEEEEEDLQAQPALYDGAAEDGQEQLTLYDGARMEPAPLRHHNDALSMHHGQPEHQLKLHPTAANMLAKYMDMFPSVRAHEMRHYAIDPVKHPAEFFADRFPDQPYDGVWHEVNANHGRVYPQTMALWIAKNMDDHGLLDAAISAKCK